jgi:nucleoside-diphosphate-sugar epimerase
MDPTGWVQLEVSSTIGRIVDIKGRFKVAYANRSTLITGGASFIGSHLAEVLVDAGAVVTVADDLSSGQLENLAAVQSRVTFLKGDLREPEFARSACNGQDIIFHLAASHGGRGYIDTHPVECTNNMLLDHAVFAAAAGAGAKKIVFASSACVYPTNLQSDKDSCFLLRETDANFEEPGKAFADGEYGWAKLMGELQLRAFCKQFGLTGVVCRIFTAYGERENESHAVIALIAKAAARLDPFPIWGDGLQKRNFTYVQDTVTGMALAGATLDSFDVVNIGSDVPYTIFDLIREIFSCMRWEPRKIRKQLDKPVGVNSRAANVTKCRDRLGWVPTHSLTEGIRRTVDWYLSSSKSRDDKTLEQRLMGRA